MLQRAAWKFLQRTEDSRQTWSWRRMGADRSIEMASGQFPSYAAAVMDAVQNGFRPKEQPYLVEWPGRLVRIAPGQRPQTILPEQLRTADPGKTASR